MRDGIWSRQFMQELGRELDARCNHGTIVFKHPPPDMPDYSLTVRGKTVWLTVVLWDEKKKPVLPTTQIDLMDKLLTAFYIHIMVENGRFQGVWISREVDRPAFWGPLGEAVRYLTTFFDLDTTDLDY